MLKKLAEVDHPYYASDNNYYTNDWPEEHDTMTDFLDEFEDADIDMNLVYRWDITPYDGYHTDKVIEGKYRAQVTIIGQRKGIFGPHIIESITEDEVERFVAYITKHWEHLQKIWAPISGADCELKEKHGWLDADSK